MSEIDTIIGYVKFVEENLNKYKKASQLIFNNEITPEIINRALSEYSVVHATLIAEYKRMKAQSYKIELDFDEWYDEKFVEVRREMISKIESKTIKLAVKEIESELRVKYKRDHRFWKEKVFAAQNKTSFILRMIDNWKKFDNILINLSLNMRSELRTLSLESRINEDRDRVRTSFKKRREPI